MDYENNSSANRADNRGLADSFAEALKHLIADDEGLDPNQIEIMDYREADAQASYAAGCVTCSYEYIQVLIDYEVGGAQREYAYSSTFRDLILDLDRAMEGKRS